MVEARPAAPALPGLLVDPSWLRDQLRRPRLRTVDLRDSDAYASGHIPGAAHLDLGRLGSSVAGCDNVILPAAAFGDLMARLGISNGDAVVAYDDQWGLAAARLLWALHYYGHSSVAVLNGGWDRWRDEGGASVEGTEPVTPGRFEASPNAEVYADFEWMTDRVRAADAVLLDRSLRKPAPMTTRKRGLCMQAEAARPSMHPTTVSTRRACISCCGAITELCPASTSRIAKGVMKTVASP